MEKCFFIENEYLYLEQVLVEFQETPIFFICSNSKGFYVALCKNVENAEYYVVNASHSQICDLLDEKISMRDIFLIQSSFWEIKASDEMTDDFVEKKEISQIQKSFLPEEKATFKILTKEIEEFSKSFKLKTNSIQSVLLEVSALTSKLSDLMIQLKPFVENDSDSSKLKWCVTEQNQTNVMWQMALAEN